MFKKRLKMFKLINLHIFKVPHDCRILCPKRPFLIPSDPDSVYSGINFHVTFVLYRTCSRYHIKNIFYFSIVNCNNSGLDIQIFA